MGTLTGSSWSRFHNADTLIHSIPSVRYLIQALRPAVRRSGIQVVHGRENTQNSKSYKIQSIQALF
jgi:hypothetical protein